MLTHAKAKALRKPGRYGDGGGLYLNIAAGGSKSWVWRAVIDGRRRALGLGSFPAVSLARAREIAAEYREAVAEGRDPTVERRQPKLPTFREAAAMFHEANAPTWAPRHARQWWQAVELHVLPRIGATRVDRITRADVLAILTPLYATMRDTGRRTRQRIRAVMAWAQAFGYVEHNPAGDAIDAALPRGAHKAEHHAAVDYREAPAALASVDALGSARLALRFLILTATRSAEARGARWDEIDGDVWAIPAERMKARRAHRVPLSRAALDVLAQARFLDDGSGLIFPSPRKVGVPVARETLSKVMRCAGLGDATPHGFRTSFRTWAEECTRATFEAKEQALAHAVGSNVERAYSRSDLLEQRRELMEQWAAYLTAPEAMAA